MIDRLGRIALNVMDANLDRAIFLVNKIVNDSSGDSPLGNTYLGKLVEVSAILESLRAAIHCECEHAKSEEVPD